MNAAFRTATQGPASREFFELAPGRERPRIAASTVSELVFVLRGAVVGKTRAETVQALSAAFLLPAEFDDIGVLLRAMDLYRDDHPDCDDCLVAAYALERGDGRVLSFDRALDRIPRVTRIEPAGA